MLGTTPFCGTYYSNKYIVQLVLKKVCFHPINKDNVFIFSLGTRRENRKSESRNLVQKVVSAVLKIRASIRPKKKKGKNGPQVGGWGWGGKKKLAENANPSICLEKGIKRDEDTKFASVGDREPKQKGEMIMEERAKGEEAR